MRRTLCLLVAVCVLVLAASCGESISAKDLETIKIATRELRPLARELCFSIDPAHVDVNHSRISADIDHTDSWNMIQDSYALGRVQTALLQAVREVDNGSVKEASVRIAWCNSTGEVISAATFTAALDDIDKHDRGIISDSDLFPDRTKLTDAVDLPEHITPNPDNAAQASQRVAKAVASQILEATSPAAVYPDRVTVLEASFLALQPCQAETLLIQYVAPGGTENAEYIEFNRCQEFIRIAVRVCEQNRAIPHQIVLTAHANRPLNDDTLYEGLKVPWNVAVEFARGNLSSTDLAGASDVFASTR
jgi:hypothetical protein